MEAEENFVSFVGFCGEGLVWGFMGRCWVSRGFVRKWLLESHGEVPAWWFHGEVLIGFPWDVLLEDYMGFVEGFMRSFTRRWGRKHFSWGSIGKCCMGYHGKCCMRFLEKKFAWGFIKKCFYGGSMVNWLHGIPWGIYSQRVSQGIIFMRYSGEALHVVLWWILFMGFHLDLFAWGFHGEVFPGDFVGNCFMRFPWGSDLWGVHGKVFA